MFPSDRRRKSIIDLKKVAETAVREANNDYKADKCWGWHHWTKWSAMDGEYKYLYQTRRCLRCGKIQDTHR